MKTAASAPLYLSRIVLNPRSRQVQCDLARPYEMHRTLMSLFPPESTPRADFRGRQGILHRVEQDPPTGAPSVVMQSQAEPAFQSLVARNGYLLAIPSNPKCKPLPNLEAILKTGRVFRFRLRANVTRKIETKSGADGRRRNGRRVALRGEEEQRAWLERKGAQHGFQVQTRRSAPDAVELVVTNEADLPGRQKGVFFSSVLFEGRLTVTDTALLSEALASGIGAAKAFGFGLLSVAAVQEFG